eukprot:1143302-Pelagomonas_calceolata.AAC.7
MVSRRPDRCTLPQQLHCPQQTHRCTAFQQSRAAPDRLMHTTQQKHCLRRTDARSVSSCTAPIRQMHVLSAVALRLSDRCTVSQQSHWTYQTNAQSLSRRTAPIRQMHSLSAVALRLSDRCTVSQQSHCAYQTDAHSFLQQLCCPQQTDAHPSATALPPADRSTFLQQPHCPPQNSPAVDHGRHVPVQCKQQ